MEKIRFITVIFLAIVLSLFIFAITKSYLYFDKGIELKEEEVIFEDNSNKSEDREALKENSKIIWDQFLVYPTNLSQEAGGTGPEGILNHAKNLTFINLNTGSVKKVFEQKVYIWDFFPGKFTIRKKSINREEYNEESLDIDKRLLIIAMTEDTNRDGFLNNRDFKKIFIYDPFREKLIPILPDKYYFEKILYNSKKGQLILIVREHNKKENTDYKLSVYVYDVEVNEGKLIKSENPSEEENSDTKEKKEDKDENNSPVPPRP